MLLYYYKDPVGNFGDDLNPWLWPRLFGRPVEQCLDSGTIFVGIGSLLNHKIPDHPPRKIVFGAGCGYGDAPRVTSDWQFRCVRGPLTAAALGLPEALAISDAALLVRELVEPGAGREGPAFMPHHKTAPYDDWPSVCKAVSVRYIDPAAPVEATLEAMRASSLLVTESLHGAIVADALRVPWIPVRTRPRILDFKWRDWSATMQLEHRFEWLPPAWRRDIDWAYKRAARPLTMTLAVARLRWLVRFGRPRLSRDHVLDDVRTRLREAFQQLARDVVEGTAPGEGAASTPFACEASAPPAPATADARPGEMPARPAQAR